jgi:uncharacterized membrane protein YeaQ/YmgE (transglycosylase-associated protein family)
MPFWNRNKNKNKSNTKYKAVFLQKEQMGYVEIGNCRIEDIGKETFTYNSHSYEINLKNKLFRDSKGFTVLFYVFNGDMLTFGEAKALMNSDELDAYIEQNIFGQLARALRESLVGNKGGWLMPIIIGAILGVAIGYFVGMNYGAKTTIQYLNQTVTPHV